jgi:cysteine desulfurase
MKNKNRIYFDHSATTSVDKRVLAEMMPYFCDKFGNPSSIHAFGQDALAGVLKARGQVAKFLNCDTSEIIFTSGATESNNLAINGLVNGLQKKSKAKLHIITSAVEHDAVLEPFVSLGKKGIETAFIGVKPNGVIDLEKLKKAITENTVLISVMYVNSEVGAIQPIKEIGRLVKNINKKRGEKSLKLYFHTDATQAVNFFDCDVKRLGADMLSLSAHKIYGPKGAGLLFVKDRTPLEAVQLGGHHENNRRSGTLNVAGIVGLGAAMELLKKSEVEKNNKKISKLRDMLIEGVVKNVPKVILNTDKKNSTPSHAHFSILGVEGEAILLALDLEGIAVSTGSACASGDLKASRVLLAMGIKAEIAHSSIRFSLGKNNTTEEVKRLIKVLPPIVKRLREMAKGIELK